MAGLTETIVNKTWDKDGDGKVDPDVKTTGGDILSGLGSAVSGVQGAVDKFLPQKPENLSDTEAAKKATAFANTLTAQQQSMAPPTYSTAPTIQTQPPPPLYPEPQPPTAEQIGNDPTGQAASQAWAEYQRKKQQYAIDKAAYDQKVAGYQEYQRIIGGPAAQVAGPQQVTATTVGAPSTNFTPNQVVAQNIAAPTGVTAQQIGSLPLVGTAGVQAPTPVTAGTVTAERIGPMQLLGVPADIDQNSIGREAQLRSLALSEAAARGEAPSAAEALLRKGIDESIGAAMGIAATTQGRNPGLAMRSGQTAAAGAIARSAADMAALRADEITKARAEALSAATNIRSGDIVIAQSNQTKNLTASVENLRTQLETAKANQETALRAGQSNQAAELQAGIANMQAQLDAAKTTAELSLRSDIANLTASLDASKANQAASLNAGIANMTAQLETMKANQQAALQAGMANQAADLQNQISQMNARLEADKANQQALLDAAKQNAANQIATNFQNASLSQQQNQFTGQQALGVAQANQRAGLETTALNNALYSGMTGNALTALGIPLNVAAGDIARQNAYNQAQTSFYTDLLKTGGMLAFGPGGAAAAATTTQLPTYGPNKSPILEA